MAVCKSCGAEIIWTLTENGKKMPLDAEPALRSGFALKQTPEHHATPIAWATPVYLSHFATCPNADAHRKEPRANSAA